MNFYPNLKKYSEIVKLDNIQNIGILIKGKDYEASSHTRLLSFFNSLNDENFNIFVIDDLELKKFKQDLINDDCFLDIIIVQRDVIDLTFAKLLINKCNLFDIKLVYELDEDLINIDKYSKKKESIKFLIEHANVVTVSTSNLKNNLSYLNDNIVVVPNVLHNVWDINVKTDFLSQDVIKIGYIDLNNSSNDIKLIKDVIIELKESFKKVGKKIIFEVIGGGDF